MEKSYYAQYYDLERRHWWFRARNRMLLEHLKRLTDGQKRTILNVGAATGHTSEMLSELGNVTSMDSDKDCCDLITRQLGMPSVHASVTALPFEDESFDIVAAFDVLEHVEEDTQAVREMQRVVKKGGIICVTAPAFEFLWSDHDEVNHHLRRYTLGKLQRLFPGNGELLFSSYFNFFLFFPIAAFRTTSRIFRRSGTRAKESDFGVLDKPALDKTLYSIFSVETLFIRNFISFPFGVSILLTWKK